MLALNGIRLKYVQQLFNIGEQVSRLFGCRAFSNQIDFFEQQIVLQHHIYNSSNVTLFFLRLYFI